MNDLRDATDDDANPLSISTRGNARGGGTHIVCSPFFTIGPLIDHASAGRQSIAWADIPDPSPIEFKARVSPVFGFHQKRPPAPALRR